MERATAAWNRYGVISATERDTPRIGVSTTLKDLGDRLFHLEDRLLPMMRLGVIPVTGPDTPLALATPHPSGYIRKEKGSLRVVKESLVRDDGKARTFLQVINLSKPLQPSMTRRLPP